jgi:hypothetical protein
MRRLHSNQNSALPSSAHELQRAAQRLQSYAASADAVPSYGITHAQVEETLDRLAVALDQMASAVPDRYGAANPTVREPALPPEARALRWHLQAAAANLRTSEAACAASRYWTRRLLEAEPEGDGVARHVA